jgi:primosomal protein N' (replication factor Y)
MKAFDAANFFASRMLPLFGDYLIGPAEPVVNRVRNKYIYEVLLKLPRDGTKNSMARQHIQQVMTIMQADTSLRSAHIMINVDPQ